MVYKRLKQTGSKTSTGLRKKGGPNDKGQFKQKKNRIGEATARKMQDKLQHIKKGENEDEIASQSDEEEFKH